MTGRVAYLDSSAFVKLIVAEPGSQALRQALTRWPDRASATLLRTEALRALRRSGNHQQIPLAKRLLRGVHMIRVDEPLLDRAGELDPPDLRSLDAIHLAAALALGADAGIMFVYDAHLRRAAESCGLEVASPE
ncbi:MAG: PIN domain-containing protein [Acidimicrobiales bacterium]